MLLGVDCDEIGEPNGVRVRDCLQIAAPCTLAPAEGVRVPVGRRRHGRKHGLDALENGLEALEQRCHVGDRDHVSCDSPR